MEKRNGKEKEAESIAMSKKIEYINSSLVGWEKDGEAKTISEK